MVIQLLVKFKAHHQEAEAMLDIVDEIKIVTICGPRGNMLTLFYKEAIINWILKI